MATEQAVLPTNAERIGRIRAGRALHSDMDWLRITRTLIAEELSGRTHDGYLCDCRCRCHRAAAPTATGAVAGSCGLRLDLGALDCGRSCRSAHILASECSLDETR
jgi:hypothetical protein